MFNKARLENLHTILTYNFTNKGSDSLYEYLYKCIKNDILLGDLDVNEKLPSKRSFAKNLGISVITVENAYEQLMAEGYIYSIPKKGFYVADLHELNLTKTPSVSPGYPKISKIYDSMHVSYSAIDLDEHGVCIDSLEDHQIDIMHLSPSHHFPTGIITPISRRYELLGWASKNENRYIIEDDYDSELRLGGKPIPTLQSIDVSDKVIYMNTFTKTLSSTVRISYMVLPASLTELFYKKLSFYSCTVSNFEQYTLARFMESGSFEKHINRLRNYYQNKRDAILEIFKTAPLDQYITIKEEDSGVHFMMKLKTDRTEIDIISDAKSKGIKLAPLSKYFVGQTFNMSFQNVYVMNYSSIDLEQLPFIFDALCQVLIK